MNRCEESLARNRAVSGDIIWTENYQRITWKEFTTTISDFRAFVHALYAKGRSQLDGLFLLLEGEDRSTVVPSARLYNTKDNRQKSLPDFSFLDDPRNEHFGAIEPAFYVVNRIANHPALTPSPHKQ
jgi:hypothetical protein